MTATPESISKARVAAAAAFEKVATSVIAIDVSERLVLTDVFVVASGETGRQVRAIVDGIDEALHKEGVRRIRREGYEGEAHWVLVDYGDIIVHVQQDEDREYYALEKLWGDCPSIDVSDLDGER
ncbi:ribosome silencing factor [Flaviflexus equikiangi]|uniref:Ribosomal silencing factor RsfS n=1 Tax=Flaviflexus equikiangi TaxID=2758573 RepID=A0ABS2TDU8_9ACTO|nr:ribosome silencing factor [Flaviflexus equikiangi]MBM9432835.1 ribosome silencing factor [Flaviflexus equikiangi]